jgi:hypothetical protein
VERANIDSTDEWLYDGVWRFPAADTMHSRGIEMTAFRVLKRVAHGHTAGDRSTESANGVARWPAVGTPPGRAPHDRDLRKRRAATNKNNLVK